MKALENKTMDSKREIDILNALDEIRAMNAKQNKARGGATPRGISSPVRLAARGPLAPRQADRETTTFPPLRVRPQLTPEEILAAIRKKGEEDDQTFGAEEDLDAVAAAEFQARFFFPYIYAFLYTVRPLCCLLLGSFVSLGLFVVTCASARSGCGKRPPRRGAALADSSNTPPTSLGGVGCAQRQTAALTGFVRRLESSSDEEGDGAKGAAKARPANGTPPQPPPPTLHLRGPLSLLR